jgi:hypothetical protein
MHYRTALIAIAAWLLTGCGGTNSNSGALAPALVRAAAGTSSGLTASPAPLELTTPATTLSFTVSDPGYKGMLKAKPAVSCASVATLSAIKVFGPNGTFDVTSKGAGRCDVTIRDSKGRSITETIHVTLTKVTIN